MRAIFAAAIAICCCSSLDTAVAQDAPTWLVGEYSGQINSRLVGAMTDFLQIKSVKPGPDGRLAVDVAFRNDRGGGEWGPAQGEATVVAPDRVKLVVVVTTPPKSAGKFDLEAKPDGTLTGILTSATGPGGASIRFEKKK
jgi:hypothetical protein